MTRRDDLPIIVDFDVTTRTCVVVCHRCTFRELVGTRAGGWTTAALHLKRAHDDIHAAHTARDCARKCADAAASPDHHAHGYKADTRRRPGATGRRGAGRGDDRAARRAG